MALSVDSLFSHLAWIRTIRDRFDMPTPSLDGKHTVFGQVRTGQDVVNKVKQGDTLKSVKIEEV